MAATLDVSPQEMPPLRQPSPLSKDSKTSTLERDAGFCSGGDEDDLEADDAPTDTSDDSVEAKAPAAASKNKRKSAEPRKVPDDDAAVASASPYKKRKHLFESRAPVPPLSDYSTASDTPPSNPRASLSPFRPWSYPAAPPPPPYTERVPAMPQQDEPLSLVLREAARGSAEDETPRLEAVRHALLPHARPRPSPKFSVESLLRPPPPPPPSPSHQHQQQRNYKNMTRERRIEANARERTRVHTISAAFDTLRRSVPSYSHNQKLSKLSVLRIACSYILTLSRVAGMDYSADQSQPSVSSCVQQVSSTIQTEGKLRRKKDD